ncbi:ImmA/IrrE family metallo-endopeptidase [Bacillaceae bacterium Marseille-Q3522]|nr:ImmA/IrrE family metallo-endopeptidase [Bacillaceae bacterium Marseille-Q3522]
MNHTLLESAIMEKYKVKAIDSLEKLSIEYLCQCFDIHVEYVSEESKALIGEDFSVIYINNNQSLKKQRADFFHEFIHVLQHFGDQRNGSYLLKEQQEQQSYWGSLYASIPLHILNKYLPAEVAELSDIFQIPEEMVRERLAQIKRKELFVISQKAIMEKQTAYRTKSNDRKHWSAETCRLLNQLKEQLKKK